MAPTLYAAKVILPYGKGTVRTVPQLNPVLSLFSWPLSSLKTMLQVGDLFSVHTTSGFLKIIHE